MNDLDNFCIANNLARDNGWSLGQQWGFAAFMNDCDKAAEVQKQRDALEKSRREAAERMAALEESRRETAEEMAALEDRKRKTAEEMAALEERRRKTIERMAELRKNIN